MHDLSQAHKWEKRTESQSKAILAEVMAGMDSDDRRQVASATELAKEFSVKPVVPCIWGWRFGNTEFGNPYLVLFPDRMHDVEQVIEVLRSVEATYCICVV